MLGDYWVPSRENVVTATYNTVLAYSMEKGYNIVVDNMNLNPKTCAELEKMVKDFNENIPTIGSMKSNIKISGLP